jgi:hypothetical protein
MSKLILRGHRGAEFRLNVTQFRSTMSASINTAQTRTMAQHFPIRAGQPDIQFTVQFRSIDDHHDFRNFVRDHQRNSQIADHTPTQLDNSGMVTLFWPERSIINWTGYITSMPVREVRFDYAPRVTFGVMLVKSMLSERTYNASSGSDFFTVAGQQIGPYLGALIEDLIRLPTPPASQQDQTDSAQQQEEQNRGILGSLFDWVGGIFP